MTDDLPAALSGDRARADAVAFATAVGEVAAGPDPPIDQLEARLDGWAAGSDEALAVAAVYAYAEVARVRPEWLADEVRKLTAATTHPSARVRQAASTALIRVSEGGKPEDARRHPSVS